MIVNYKMNGWGVVTQRAHGLLAFQIAVRWRKKDQGPRWEEFLVAVADHDGAQIELERRDLLTPEGGPLDYKSAKFELEHGQRTMESALGKSRYIALLCSMHLEFITGDQENNNAPAQQFFKTQKILRTQWRKQLGITEARARFDYALLEWCDALSLLICQRENQPEERPAEIGAGPDNNAYQMVQTGSSILTVSPWPFEEDQFEVHFERRVLQQLKFRSAEQFKKVFMKASVKEKSWTIRKGKS
jgi:hypothetical protein